MDEISMKEIAEKLKSMQNEISKLQGESAALTA